MKYRLLPYSVKKLSTTNLVSGYFGNWCFLDDDELSQLKMQKFSESLQEKILNAGIIAAPDNVENIIKQYRSLHKNLFIRPSLHIINLTNTCNYRCVYCHAGVSQGKEKMSLETATAALKFIFESSGQSITIEFQGGEALLNWEVLQYIVTESQRICKTSSKSLILTLVSNLSLMTQEKMQFLIQNDVGICTSIDGPASLMNQNRGVNRQENVYESTRSKIDALRKMYTAQSSTKKIGALATITRKSLTNWREIIDTYIDLEMYYIHLRPLNNLGDALTNWTDISYTAEEFNEMWHKSMEYIVDLNKNGTQIIERGTLIKLRKILQQKDPLYIDLMSPAASGRSVLLYNFDGGVYDSDEGRMYHDKTFQLGLVTQKYSEVLGNDDSVNVWAASLLDLTCYHCTYKSWCGTSPVINYQTSKSLVTSIMETFWHKVHEYQFTYIMEKIAKNGPEKDIFINWLSYDVWN